MKVTKEQKVFFGLLVVGLVALGVDRFVLSPGTAEASDDSASLLVAKAPTSAAGAASPATAVKSPAVATANNPIAQKLNDLSESLHLANAPVKDSFSVPAAWNEKPGTVGATGKSFEQSHELSGVMVSGRHPAAMIDGKLVQVGQTVDGYKLVSVMQGAAVFQSADTFVTLRSR